MEDYSKFKFFRITFPHEYVAHVEINREDKLNAFSQPMWLELRELFNTLSIDSAVRAVVLSGAGDRAFTAGLDIDWALSDRQAFNPDPNDGVDVGRRATFIRRFALEFQDCVSAIEKCDKPVICVLHGIAIGIAIDISTCADVRICSADARMSVKEIDIGLAADVGTLTRLPKVVGNYSWVKEMALTAEMFDPEEARQVGFVSRVKPTKAEAIQDGLRIAKLIASKSPVAAQGTKNFLDWSRDRSVADGLTYTAVWNAGAVQTPDIKIALEAIRKRSKPKFANL